MEKIIARLTLVSQRFLGVVAAITLLQLCSPPSRIPTDPAVGEASGTLSPVVIEGENNPPLTAPSSFAATPQATSLCPPLPEPSGPTVIVSTEADLRSQAYSAVPGTTIFVTAGTYHLQGVVQVINDGIAIRGATGNRDDVILDGGGMLTWSHTHVILIEADDVTVANLTIRNADQHGISVNGSDRPFLYNLHIADTGYQLVKVNPMGDGSEDGVLACSHLEYTTASPEEYTNGISAHNAHRWTVRDNVWERIRTPGNTPAPTILFWSGSTDTVVERNLLVDCYQGIAFGNASHTGANDHVGGIVCNNVIYASMDHDSVVEMVHATGWLVAHNTALLLDPAPGLTWGMEARFSDTSGTFAYNLLNLDVINRDGAGGTMTGNVTSAGATWFVDADSGDLHLLPSAAGAVDQADVLTEVRDDFDGHSRPIGVAPDVGADEVLMPPSLVVTPTAYLPLVTMGAVSGEQVKKQTVAYARVVLRVETYRLAHQRPLSRRVTKLYPSRNMRLSPRSMVQSQIQTIDGPSQTQPGGYQPTELIQCTIRPNCP